MKEHQSWPMHTDEVIPGMEGDAGDGTEWLTVINPKKRKERDRRGYNSQDSDIDRQQVKTRKMDEKEGNYFKVFFKKKAEVYV